MLHPYLIPETKPKAKPEQVIILDNTRISVLSPILIRVEVSDTRVFLDKATQIVWYRDLPAALFTLDFDDKEITVSTEKAKFHFNRSKRKVDYVIIDGVKIDCNNKKNLKGTKRTLDGTCGAVKLNNGICSQNGVTVLDDNSLVLDDDGMLKPRETGTDTYIFASKDYKAALKSFYMITGFPPMMPRYALGNWWSRYHAYTADEYVNLMERFKKEDVPFSVATVDMDWHWVKIEKEFGEEYKNVKGWTGYSFNKKLFPDYKAFFKSLKDLNLKISLNLHPADGVRSYEDAYPEMAKAMGVDSKTKESIPFDFTDPKFINAYFDVLHRPYERDGVDVWWIDWQQGNKTKLAGYDPLWGLNHYHTLDNGTDNRRPLILSRYAELGSHRYPLGFSGDTMILWSVLRFQPYFTATASNSGFITWSHDIGGHMFGTQNVAELYLRWVQLGVFSPILRLHSTATAKGKEPWNFQPFEEKAKTALRFRMRLIPYLYTAYMRAYKEGRAPIEPLYYNYPNTKAAYKYKREFFFGSELIVSPITTVSNKVTGKSSVRTWLPDGYFTDIYTGKRYEGGKMHVMVRGYDSIPILAKEGAIIPLSNNKGNDVSNPQSMDVLVYAGTNTYTLYEDDGETQNYKKGICAETDFSVTKIDDTMSFTLSPVRGDASLVPEKREYNIYFKDVTAVSAEINGKPAEIKPGEIKFTFNVSPEDEVKIKLVGVKIK